MPAGSDPSQVPFGPSTIGSGPPIAFWSAVLPEGSRECRQEPFEPSAPGLGPASLAVGEALDVAGAEVLELILERGEAGPSRSKRPMTATLGVIDPSRGVGSKTL